MSRNDGRPRSAVSLSLDPLPYVHECWDDGTCMLNGKRRAERGINDEFDPRPGFVQEEEAYQ